MTCIRRNLDTQNCCNQWQKGIRTINQTYPDDNREFEIRAGSGILVTPITAGILITNSSDPGALEAGSNIELTPNGDHLIIGVVDGPTFDDDTVINGDLSVNGNIYNQGASYESHMEQVYTTNDYIIMRDGAVTGLAAGSYAGFQVKLYDGVNDGRLVMDNSGVARVGDVGDEQPLLTREESADLNDGALLKWDAANSKAVDEGTVGTDTKPIKIMNGIATAVTDELQTKLSILSTSASTVSLSNNANTITASITADRTGTALIIFRTEFSTASSGTRVVGYNIGTGSTKWLANPLCDPTPPNTTVVTITYAISVTNGDIVNVRALQTSGTALTANVDFTMIII